MGQNIDKSFQIVSKSWHLYPKCDSYDKEKVLLLGYTTYPYLGEISD